MQPLARNRLITENLSYSHALAANVIREFNLQGVVPPEDVFADAHIGLIKAADRFRPDEGTAFRTFSYQRIRGAVIEGLRRSNRARGHHRQFKASGDVWAARSAPLPKSQRHSKKGRFDEDYAAYLSEPGIEHIESLTERAQVDATDPSEAIALRDALAKAIRRLPELQRQVIVLFYFEDLDRDRIAKRLGCTSSYIGRLRHRGLANLAESVRAIAGDYVPEASR
jgi:RNA polymerase sigma factor (sigma-70 family)